MITLTRAKCGMPESHVQVCRVGGVFHFRVLSDLLDSCSDPAQQCLIFALEGSGDGFQGPLLVHFTACQEADML